jgi:hypothetical protein
MFAQVPERQMHWVRWVLTGGWVLIILSLFYDPWTAALTEPDHPWSPLSISDTCVQVQGQCVVQEPYPLGATVFWGMIVPSGIFILLIFGHELWRRICPLSFLSQIPRALGWQRQFKRENKKTGKVRFELAKVKSDSWLGRNYQVFQFGYLFIGLCGRILFFNADRLVLGSWLAFTILAAVAVGYFYGGKSWCQYFCPMAPVQTVFSEPRGLLGSKAHTSDSRITQSMCRTVTPEGKEQSACVACQSPCFDIDSERTYWDGINTPQESLIRYGYLGLVVGYFVYYYLYAGNWDYYFSGVWNRDPNQLAALMNPGLYLFGQPIGIPKLFAVPLVLGAFTLAGIGLGRLITRRAKAQRLRRNPSANTDLVQHRCFAITTFVAFNVFFFFAGRPLLRLTPLWLQFLFDGIILFASTLWLRQSWGRNPALYTRENLASRLRKQLEKLHLDVSQVLEGRSLEDLSADEVYVLAKVLPDFTQEKRHQAYKGVVRDALAEGYVSTATSLDVLQQMRRELNVSDDEHRQVLEELGIEDPDLLNPERQRSLENQIRLTGYQRSLERLMRLQAQPELTGFAPSLEEAATLQALRQEYSITPQEEEWILRDLDPEGMQKAAGLLARLRQWVDCDRALALPTLQPHAAVLSLAQEAVARKQDLIVRSLLTTLPTLADHPDQANLVQALHQLAPPPLAAYLNQPAWRQTLPEATLKTLTQPPGENTATPSVPTPQAAIDHLEHLLHHYNPLVASASLYLLAQLDPDRSRRQAQAWLHETAETSALGQDTARALLAASPAPPLRACPSLEKLVYLFNSDFFHKLDPATLTTLADQAEVRTYAPGDAITEAGDTCRELLILMAGEATIRYQGPEGARVEPFHPGQTLDELAVLTHGDLENTILADSEETRILAVPVDAFDALFDQDGDFARRVLELESQRLQQLMKPLRMT